MKNVRNMLFLLLSLSGSFLGATPNEENALIAPPRYSTVDKVGVSVLLFEIAVILVSAISKPT